jgi:Flp pilus assembly protein TadG
VEFALVFPLFFLIIYATLTYGLIFTAQQSLNYAAQSGARAALQWPDCTDVSLSPLQCRAETALKEAQKDSNWIGSLGGKDLTITVCSGSGANQLAPDVEVGCDPMAASPGANPLRVTVSYPYLEAPLVPLLGPSTLMGFTVPTVLTAAAQINLAISQDAEGGS